MVATDNTLLAISSGWLCCCNSYIPEVRHLAGAEGWLNCGSLFGCSRLAILSKHVYSNFTPYPVVQNLAELSHCNDMEASSSLAALSILVVQQVR
jgi:hypothetical protein